jgi:hypothetical protein
MSASPCAQRRRFAASLQAVTSLQIQTDSMKQEED